VIPESSIPRQISTPDTRLGDWICDLPPMAVAVGKNHLVNVLKKNRVDGRVFYHLPGHFLIDYFAIRN
jgi:hypothetical protein